MADFEDVVNSPQTAGQYLIEIKGFKGFFTQGLEQSFFGSAPISDRSLASIGTSSQAAGGGGDDPLPTRTASGSPTAGTPQSSGVADAVSNTLGFGNAISVNQSLGTGINVAAAANVIRDNFAGTAGSKTIVADTYTNLKTQGFQHVRWAFEAQAHADSSGNVSTAYLDFISQHVGWAVQAGLGGIVTVEHFYSSLMNDPTNESLITRFEQICKDVTGRLNGLPANIVVEPFNEPKFPNMTTALWNAIFPRLIKAIRAVDTDNRTIMIDTGGAANPSRLDDLTLTGDASGQGTSINSDGNIIVSVHQYDPFSFTHASSADTTWSSSSSTDTASVDEAYGFMDTFWNANGIPLNNGEWGANHNADDASKTDWIQYNKDTHINPRSSFLSSTHWVFIKGNFGIYDAVAAGNTTTTSDGPWDVADRDAILSGTGGGTGAVGVVLNQSAYRFRNDDGTASTATWKAVKNADVTIAAGETFRLRMSLDNTGDSDSQSGTVGLQYNHNSTGWTLVSQSSEHLRASSSSNVSSGADNTERVGTDGASASTFAAGRINATGQVANQLLANQRFTEYEFILVPVGGAVQDGDTIDVRMTFPSASTTLDNYLQQPRLTVGTPGSEITVSGSPTAQAATASGSSNSTVTGVNLVQSKFRFRNDDGDESTATWKAAADTNVSIAADTKFRLRMSLDNTGTVTSSSGTVDLQYRKNGGSWASLRDASSNIHATTSANAGYSTAPDNTERLGTSGGSSSTFNVGATSEFAQNTSETVPAGEFNEYEWCFTMPSADVTTGDEIEIRYLFPDPDELDSYLVIPKVTVS